MEYQMPLYIQLQNMIIKKIEEKEYLPGEMIPSERKMAESYGINRMTVKKAIKLLVEKGYLYRVQGSGTFVASVDNPKMNMEFAAEQRNAGITAMLRESGIQSYNTVLAKGILGESLYFSYHLALEADQTIWGLHRVRFGGKDPIAVEYTYVPQKYFEDIDEIDFEKVSLYDYMDARDHLPQHFVQTLDIVEAGEKESELLHIDKGSVIFKIAYTGADKNYNIVEYTECYMNPVVMEFQYQVQVN